MLTPPTVAQANTAKNAAYLPLLQQGAATAPPDGYVPLTPEGLLIFCQTRLRDLDTAIHAKMQKQNDKVALQDAVSQIQAAIVAGDGKVNGDSAVAYDNEKTVADISAQIDKAVTLAQSQGDTGMAASLESVKAVLQRGKGETTDGFVTKDEVKEMSKTLESALSASHSGAEISMIELQSLVSQRSTSLQLTTGMMNSVNEGTKSVAGNIGR